MNELTTFTADLDVARDLASHFRADNTYRVYKAGADQFVDYCTTANLDFLPATSEAVCAFVAHLVKEGKSVGTIKARISAIKWFHKMGGYPSPTDDPKVEMVMAGVSRKHGVAPKQASPMLSNTVTQVIDAIADDDQCADRDRALLLTAFFGGFRRSEIVNIQREHVTVCPQGVTIFLPSSKTDQLGEGRHVAIARQHNAYCPVKALEKILPDSGRVFPISDRMVHKIISKLCKRAGLDADAFSPHSLRAGMVTQARINNVAKSDIRRITGHKSDAMIDHYTRVVDQWQNNATVGLI